MYIYIYIYIYNIGNFFNKLYLIRKHNNNSSKKLDTCFIKTNAKIESYAYNKEIIIYINIIYCNSLNEIYDLDHHKRKFENLVWIEIFLLMRIIRRRGQREESGFWAAKVISVRSKLERVGEDGQKCQGDLHKVRTRIN